MRKKALTMNWAEQWKSEVSADRGVDDISVEQENKPLGSHLTSSLKCYSCCMLLLCRPAVSLDFVSKRKGLHFCLERRHSTHDFDEIRNTWAQKPGKSWYFLGFTCRHWWKL